MLFRHGFGTKRHFSSRSPCDSGVICQRRRKNVPGVKLQSRLTPAYCSARYLCADKHAKILIPLNSKGSGTDAEQHSGAPLRELLEYFVPLGMRVGLACEVYDIQFWNLFVAIPLGDFVRRSIHRDDLPRRQQR